MQFHFGSIMVNRIAVVLMGTVFLGVSVCAQTFIEFQAGVNMANLSNPDNLVAGADWHTRYGFVALASVSFPISSGLLISPGLRFVQKGTQFKWWSDFAGNVEGTLTNNYIELPIHLRYELSVIDSRLFVVGGPSLGYLIRSQTDATMQFSVPYSAIETNEHLSSDSKKNYKSYDVSIDVGFMFQIPLTGSFAIIASVEYSLGLVKVSQYGSNEQTRDLRVTLGTSYSIR
jgi:hypothetical protein